MTATTLPGGRGRTRTTSSLVMLGALLAGSLTALSTSPAGAADTLLSQGRTATASSTEGPFTPTGAR